MAANRICVVTFNRDAAAELVTPIGARLRPLVPSADEIEVRTLHALARQVVLDAGQAVELVADRLPLLLAARRRCAAALPGRAAVPEASVLDTMLSAWKIEGRSPPPEAETALAAYQSLLAAPGSFDFDDLKVGHDFRLHLGLHLVYAAYEVDVGHTSVGPGRPTSVSAQGGPEMVVPGLDVRPVVSGLVTPTSIAFIGPNDSSCWRRTRVVSSGSPEGQSPALFSIWP